MNPWPAGSFMAARWDLVCAAMALRTAVQLACWQQSARWLAAFSRSSA